jgi:hypothetical protein
MNLIFTYVVTGLLIIIGLLSLGQDFVYTPFYILFSLLGLLLSFWQQKKKPIPYLRLTTNIILVILTAKALFPFFIGRPKQDMFTILITTWIYFLILSAYIIYTKRDYYIIQGLSLGLIVYACFYATRNPLPLLGYTTAFLVIWIMALRNINLFPESKGEKTVSYSTGDIWREIKLGALLFLGVVIISLPFYFLLPRFNIPLLPMDRILKQRYSVIYADFPKRGLVIFLSRNPRDVMTEDREAEGETPSLTQKGGTQSQIEISSKVTKPVFWHAQENMEKIKRDIRKNKQKLENLAKQYKLDELKKDIQEYQQLREQEEKINEEKKELEKALQEAKEEYQKLVQIQANPPQELAGNAQDMKELENKMKSAQEQMQKLEAQVKELDVQLQAIEEGKSQIQASVYKEATLTTPQIRALWDQKEEQEKQLKALSEEIKNLPAEQQLKPAEQQPKAPEEKPKNQEEIEKLEQKIQKTDQELKDLAQQNKLPDIEKNIQEHQKLLEQQDRLNQDKKELEKALAKAREEYIKLAEIQSNPGQDMANNPAALKAVEDKMKGIENKVQNMADDRKALDKQSDKIREAIIKIRASIYKEAVQTTQKIRILWDKKEEQHEELNKLKGGAEKSFEEGRELDKSMETEESSKPDKDKESRTKKPETQKTTRQINILDIILYILIIATIIYVIRSILVFIFPYLKHKRRILRASHSGEYNLAISLLYNFLGRVLYIFGYKYPVVMLPEEYLKIINNKFSAISSYAQDLTGLFIEARYSLHQLGDDQVKAALEDYRNILQELKNSGLAWQRNILKIRFLFEL